MLASLNLAVNLLSGGGDTVEGQVWKVGEHCWAQWSDGHYYYAEIIGVAEEGKRQATLFMCGLSGLDYFVACKIVNRRQPYFL